MLGSVIDTAVGLVFVYLLLSLIVTAVIELIETVIKLRGAHLAKGIEKLLGSDKAKDFFGQALVKGLSPNSWFSEKARNPSYIPSRTFAASVLNMVAAAKTDGPRTLATVRKGITDLPDGDLKQSLTVLLEEAQHNLDKFEENLEIWFNNQMARVAGWYKRKVQVITLVVALAITISVNADSILIFRTLSRDSALRASLVAQAETWAKQPPADAPKKDAKSASQGDMDADEQIVERLARVDQAIKRIGGLGLPIGWLERPKDRKLGDRDKEDPDFRWWPGWPMFEDGASGRWAHAFPAHVWGWLLTAFAISLGAPFWFDILNKVVSIRSAGKAPEEKPKPPKEEPKPLGPGETPDEKRTSV